MSSAAALLALLLAFAGVASAQQPIACHTVVATKNCECPPAAEAPTAPVAERVPCCLIQQGPTHVMPLATLQLRSDHASAAAVALAVPAAPPVPTAALTPCPAEPGLGPPLILRKQSLLR